MRDFRKLEVWNLARALAARVYSLSEGFPIEERFGITSQLRRAAISIAANLAEGCGRDSDKDFLRFIRIALGSLNEVETIVLIAFDLKMLSEDQLNEFETFSRDLGVKLRNLAKKIDRDLSPSI